MLHRLYFYKVAARFKISDNSLAAFLTCHALVFAALLIYGRVFIHDIYHWEIMTQSHLKVIRVVSRSDLDNACSEIHFHIFIGNDWYFSVKQRQNAGLADKVLVSFVIRMNSYSRIAYHSFGTCGGKLQISASISQRVTQMPEERVLLFKFNLSV